MKKTVNQRGFTLVELMVSISLLGMLLALSYMVFGHLLGTYDRTEQKWLLERNVNQLVGQVQQILDLSYGVELTNTVPDVADLDDSASLLYYDAGSGNVYFQDKKGSAGRPALMQLNEDKVALTVAFAKAEKNATEKYNNALDVTVSGRLGEMTYAQTVTVHMPNIHGNIATADDSGVYTAVHFASTSDGASLNLKNDTVPGGCFIATAAYGDYDQSNVMLLRRFRDQILLTNEPGRLFVTTYYRLSPPIADAIAVHPLLRLVTRILLLPLQGVAVLLLHPLFGGVICALFGAGLVLFKRNFTKKQGTTAME